MSNLLASEPSAYLRSAAHQPVHWHPWGEAAFQRARAEDKPVLLDIGAVWCHWCHVMDGESYEDPEVAGLLNREFVCVKVDRDERPDVDARYQRAVQALTGQGGWPLTAFLTPAGEVFFGGTYFPPEDNHYGRPGFISVLKQVAELYRRDRARVSKSATAIRQQVTESLDEAKAGQVTAAILDEAAGQMARLFDIRYGGFGTAPKFPHPAGCDFLLARWHDTREGWMREVVEKSLTGMARGGIRDHVGGGFHRYSVDERWIVPHFEKMSYDNSELLKNYVHACQATGNEFYAAVARDIIRWMDEWLSDREQGGFYASQDADINMDDDGDYFTWTLDEARSVLTEEEAEVAALHYDINEVGEMHHNPAKNVLYVRAPVEEIARRLSLTSDRVKELLASAKKKMYAARLQRPTPYVDKTVYVSWNSMCVSAYLEAAKVLHLDDARRFALRSLDRILSEAWKPRHEQS